MSYDIHRPADEKGLIEVLQQQPPDMVLAVTTRREGRESTEQFLRLMIDEKAASAILPAAMFDRVLVSVGHEPQSAGCFLIETGRLLRILEGEPKQTAAEQAAVKRERAKKQALTIAKAKKAAKRK